MPDAGTLVPAVPLKFVFFGFVPATGVRTVQFTLNDLGPGTAVQTAYIQSMTYNATDEFLFGDGQAAVLLDM